MPLLLMDKGACFCDLKVDEAVSTISSKLLPSCKIISSVNGVPFKSTFLIKVV